MNLSKKLIYISAFALLAISCDREFDSEGVSRITTYATLTMQGEVWNRIAQGGTWTDQGVTAKEGEADIEVTVGGDVVDVNTPGAYAISYTATNKDGFSFIKKVSSYRNTSSNFLSSSPPLKLSAIIFPVGSSNTL